MTSNTSLRIISAIVLIFIVGLCVYLGPMATVFLIGLVGLVTLHEINCNFLKLKIQQKTYALNILSFVAIFIFVVFQKNNDWLLTIINNAGIVLNFSLLVFLFATKSDSRSIVWFLRKFRLSLGVLVAVMALNLAHLMFFADWRALLWGLVLMNFSVDTAAWFFGKNFGKTKLWEKVSPKKTVEGAVGGVLTSVVLTSVYWHQFIKEINIQVITSLFILACFAQVGDLIQSKLKRSFNIKDSSNLIPGHGGVYDRIDSLLFVAPFYILLIKSSGIL